ncbi:1968_t:CDS:2 [Diversispora eburnea]|uniref:Zinc finger protein 830 n=1 Tax=Diversispora eburnea TaxID=1213867 RepID=A0A9N9FY47_9GLOM|nr:1968_t:CDS:2 [Diversispora eburnea]
MSAQKSKELRRLLSKTLQQRQQQASTSSKVNHPSAKYDNNNRLICIECSIPVKNSSLWKAHLAGSGHKEALKRSKGVKEKVSGSSTQSKINNKIEKTPENYKKRSIGSESDKISSGKVTSDMNLKGLINYGSESEVENNNDQTITRIKRVKNSKKDSVELLDNPLPADFFDDSSKNPVITTQEETIREIDEEEWMRFQKLISKETEVSNQIAFADEEELQRDRDEMLEREQEMCFMRSERLKEAVNRVKESKENNMVLDESVKEELSESDEDEDISEDYEDGWMDWRAQRII